MKEDVKGPLDSLSDYKEYYGMLDFKDKVILDIGSDYGSTAIFALNRGANKVIAVDKKKGYINSIKKCHEIPTNENIIPIHLNIQSKDDFKDLIEEYKVDLALIDCEGCEEYFLDLECETIRKIKEYHIEGHEIKTKTKCEDINNKIKNKLKKCNYKILKIIKSKAWPKTVKMFWARRNIYEPSNIYY